MVTSGSYALVQETRVAWQQSSMYSSFHIYSEMFLVLIITTTDQTHLKLCFNVFWTLKALCAITSFILQDD